MMPPAYVNVGAYDEDDAMTVETLANLASDIIARKHADLSEQKLLKILFHWFKI